MGMELGARFEIKSDRTWDIEIDLDYCETKEEAFGDAIDELIAGDNCLFPLVDDDIELVEVVCWSSDLNIIEFSSDINWISLFKNTFSRIYDLNQLNDDEDRTVALYLHRNGGYADLRDACCAARQQSYVMHKNESELIDQFIESENIKATVVPHLDHESILDEVWPDRVLMPDKKVLIMMD